MLTTVSGCPHTMDPTLGAKFGVMGITSPFRGDGVSTGPTVEVDK